MMRKLAHTIGTAGVFLCVAFVTSCKSTEPAVQPASPLCETPLAHRIAQRATQSDLELAAQDHQMTELELKTIVVFLVLVENARETGKAHPLLLEANLPQQVVEIVRKYPSLYRDCDSISTKVQALGGGQDPCLVNCWDEAQAALDRLWDLVASKMIGRIGGALRTAAAKKIFKQIKDNWDAFSTGFDLGKAVDKADVESVARAIMGVLGVVGTVAGSGVWATAATVVALGSFLIDGGFALLEIDQTYGQCKQLKQEPMCKLPDMSIPPDGASPLPDGPSALTDGPSAIADGPTPLPDGPASSSEGIPSLVDGSTSGGDAGPGPDSNQPDMAPDGPVDMGLDIPSDLSDGSVTLTCADIPGTQWSGTFGSTWSYSASRGIGLLCGCGGNGGSVSCSTKSTGPVCLGLGDFSTADKANVRAWDITSAGGDVCSGSCDYPLVSELATGYWTSCVCQDKQDDVRQYLQIKCTATGLLNTAYILDLEIEGDLMTGKYQSSTYTAGSPTCGGYDSLQITGNIDAKYSGTLLGWPSSTQCQKPSTPPPDLGIQLD